MNTTTEREDPEWRRQADAEPYRIACYVMSHASAPWHVTDVASGDSNTSDGGAYPAFRTLKRTVASVNTPLTGCPASCPSA